MGGGVVTKLVDLSCESERFGEVLRLAGADAAAEELVVTASECGDGGQIAATASARV